MGDLRCFFSVTNVSGFGTSLPFFYQRLNLKPMNSLIDRCDTLNLKTLNSPDNRFSLLILENGILAISELLPGH
jgi:hypothetical protein